MGGAQSDVTLDEHAHLSEKHGIELQSYMTHPKFSVNIPILPKTDITSVLESLKKVRYPKHKIEIVVVEGNHIAKQRNAAIHQSLGEFVYLLDNDSRVHPDCFRLLDKEFQQKKVVAVGGPSLTDEDGNYLNFLIGSVLETYFGAMRMRFRYSRQDGEKGDEYQLIGANLALRKQAIELAGLFNEKVVPNEETELLRRLSKKGFNLRYNKHLAVFRPQRKTLIDLAKQFHHYGVGRMKQINYNGSAEDFLFLVPVGFMMYLFGIPFARNWLYIIPLFIYGFLSFATSMKAGLKYRRIDLFFTMPLIFPIIHLSYAAGICKEFFDAKMNLKNRKRRTMKMNVIKLFLADYNSDLPGKRNYAPKVRNNTV